jgi:hypothetical protein
MSASARRYYLIAQLNARGLKGPIVKSLLRRHAQDLIARQIDYYDFELTSLRGASLPRWAAAPWLAYRVRRELPPPVHFLEPATGALWQLRALPNEAGHRQVRGEKPAAG